MNKISFPLLALMISLWGLPLGSVCSAAEPIEVSGVYPHLSMYNNDGECGTGAVVPWAGRLWAVTYVPQGPTGSSGSLVEITPELEITIRPESIGGTPANRMIHRESDQLFIGPYVISGGGDVRVIPYTRMPGRPTGTARHLTDPVGKVYTATMEEGLYTVDVVTLEVTEHIKDGNGQAAVGSGIRSKLPGYHGKGLFSGQGRLVYSNNGERNKIARRDPTVPSGALAEWTGEGDWSLVRRNQFTEVSGPGGIYGSSAPATDPIWAMGWDPRSLILALLEDGTWSYYRLPKNSHSYDGAHGWNTEWPRIREIGESDLLATMHGTFWRFPATFSRKNSAGIAPRSNYLKVIGDFCRWNDRVVLGCDDSAKSEFLNVRSFKARHAAPGQSNSNLWFVRPERLDNIGPVIGRGSVWLRDDVAADTPSDPYLFAGYDRRMIHLKHETATPVEFLLEVDRDGTDDWTSMRTITVAANGSESVIFTDQEAGTWIRLTAKNDATGVTANFQYQNADSRPEKNAPLFAGVATPDTDEAASTGGLMWSRSHDSLQLAVGSGSAYELDPSMTWKRIEDQHTASKIVRRTSQPVGVYSVDAASVILEEDGKRYRLPKNDAYVAAQPTTPVDAADADAANLAAGATATASSVLGDRYTADKVLDGDTSDASRWVSETSGDKWLQLDFDAPQTFQSVRVTTGWQQKAAYAVSSLLVQVESDGKWTNVPGGEMVGNNSMNLVINFDAPVTASRVRLVSFDSDPVRMYEVALFAKPQPGAMRSGLGIPRVCREVATERDLLNVHGTFYELPARNAQGLAKVRPVATHNLAIADFCSHAGLLCLTGIQDSADGEHIFRSDDGRAAIWAGVVDDLWKLGKPRGTGGPWKDSALEANETSDPYLMTAYDQKSVMLSSTAATTVTIEVDVDGTGLWVPYKSFDLQAGESVDHDFPVGFNAYWVRARTSQATTATAWFTYR